MELRVAECNTEQKKYEEEHKQKKHCNTVYFISKVIRHDACEARVQGSSNKKKKMMSSLTTEKSKLVRSSMLFTDPPSEFSG